MSAHLLRWLAANAPTNVRGEDGWASPQREGGRRVLGQGMKGPIPAREKGYFPNVSGMSAALSATPRR